MNGSSFIHRQVVPPISYSSFCHTFDFFLLFAQTALGKFSLQVSKEVKTGSLKTYASAEFHKIIDHISTV